MDKRELTAALLLQGKLNQYKLEQYTTDELVKIYTAMNKVEKEILAGWGKTIKTEFSQARAFAMLEEAKGMIAGVKVAAGESISETMGKVSAESAKATSEALSFGGKAAHVYDVALSPDKMAAFWKTTPVGGFLLQDWVNKSFDKDTIERIQQEVAAGYFLGEGYPKMAKRLKEGFGMSRNQIDTLVRTYVQTANAEAMKRVYQANKDLIKWLRWSAAYDTRTCLVCANLEGKNFPLDEHPPCPCHCRCRCQLVPVTTIAKLGVTKEAAREWMKKKRMEAAAIDPSVLKDPMFNPDGTLKKNMKSWIFGLSESEQVKFFGPTRFKLIQAGEVSFEDLVDLNTYKIKTLAQLKGDVELSIKAKAGSAEALVAIAAKAEAAKVKEQLVTGQMQADLDEAKAKKEVAAEAAKQAAKQAAKEAAEKEANEKLKVEFMEATVAGKEASKEATDAWVFYSTKEEGEALKQAIKEKIEADKAALWASFKNPNAVTTFEKNAIVPDQFKALDQPDLGFEEVWEPEMDGKPGKGKSTGAIVFDEDTGKVFIYEPKDHFGGYEHTFPKGQLEPGLSMQQNAVKEIWEEIGLDVDTLDHLGDYEKTTSVSRYYIARFKGGNPTMFQPDETWNVKVVPVHELGKYLNKAVDKKIAQEFADAYYQALLKGSNDPVAGFNIMNTEKAQAAKEAAETAQKAAESAAKGKGIAEGMAKAKANKEEA